MHCLVVEDHIVFADLLGAMLGSLCGIKTVSVSHDLKSARKSCRTTPPDLLLLNPEMPGGDALDLVRSLSRSNVTTVLLSASRSRIKLQPSLRPHVHCVLGRDEGFDVLRGEIERLGAVPTCPFSNLGPRERQMLSLIGRGLRSKEIADAMGLTKASVDTYRKRISTKLRSSGADLVRLAALHSQLRLAA